MMNKHILFIAVTLLSSQAAAQTKDDPLTFTIEHQLMLDGDYLTDWHDQQDGFSGETRRLKTSLILKQQNWSVKAKIDFDIDNKTQSVDDLYYQYHGWDWGQVKVGKQKEVFGLENSTSASQLATIERAMSTQAFAPGRNDGISLASETDQLKWWLGIFNNDSYDSGKVAITGRASYQMLKLEDNNLQFGASFSRRRLDGTKLDIKSALEIHSALDVVDTKKQSVDDISLFGTEAQWSNGKVKVAGEWFWQQFSLSDSTNDINHKGWYVQTSYLLNDGQYQLRQGKLARARLSTKHNYWELVSRYSQLDTLESTKGTQVENWLVGINYYLSKDLKIMSGFTYSTMLAPISQSGKAISLRIQYLL